MPDSTFIPTVIGMILSAIYTATAVASVIIQHRRTPKLPKPPLTPTCTTILGANMHGDVRDLPGDRQK